MKDSTATRAPRRKRERAEHKVANDLVVKTPHKEERLTLSEIIRMQLAYMKAQSVDRSSVKLTRNARGETQVEIKVTTGEHGIETVEDAAATAKRIYDGLIALYHQDGEKQ